jgi:hypothetical protein
VSFPELLQALRAAEVTRGTAQQPPPAAAPPSRLSSTSYGRRSSAGSITGASEWALDPVSWEGRTVLLDRRTGAVYADTAEDQYPELIGTWQVGRRRCRETEGGRTRVRVEITGGPASGREWYGRYEYVGAGCPPGKAGTDGESGWRRARPLLRGCSPGPLVAKVCMLSPVSPYSSLKPGSSATASFGFRFVSVSPPKPQCARRPRPPIAQPHVRVHGYRVSRFMYSYPPPFGSALIAPIRG